MNDKTVVPYRTPSGLEIGKFYVPPKARDNLVDFMDIHDRDLIQTAYIKNEPKNKNRGYGSLHAYLVFVAFMALLELYLALRT